MGPQGSVAKLLFLLPLLLVALQPQSKVGGPVSGPGVNPARNVIGGELDCCCADVRGTGIGTGFFRDGHCSTGLSDQGRSHLYSILTLMIL
jgi:hypothetical protein